MGRSRRRPPRCGSADGSGRPGCARARPPPEIGKTDRLDGAGADHPVQLDLVAAAGEQRPRAVDLPVALDESPQHSGRGLRGEWAGVDVDLHGVDLLTEADAQGARERDLLPTGALALELPED